MEKHLELLGCVVRDRISGMEGTCDSICFDLYGCVQGCITPKVDPTKPTERPSGQWYDTKRLEAIGMSPMERPTFDNPPGPASKPAPR
jgi:hypothetical protein